MSLTVSSKRIIATFQQQPLHFNASSEWFEIVRLFRALIEALFKQIMKLQRSPPIKDSKGTKTFVYYRRSLLQEGQNSKEIQLKGVNFNSTIAKNLLKMMQLKAGSTVMQFIEFLKVKSWIRGMAPFILKTLIIFHTQTSWNTYNRTLLSLPTGVTVRRCSAFAWLDYILFQISNHPIIPIHFVPLVSWFILTLSRCASFLGNFKKEISFAIQFKTRVPALLSSNCFSSLHHLHTVFYSNIMMMIMMMIIIIIINDLPHHFR